MKKTILFDVDGVIRDIIPPILAIYKREYDSGSNYKRDDITEHSIEKFMPGLRGCDMKDFFVKHATEIFGTSKVTPYAKETMLKLIRDYNLHIVTNQFRGAEGVTVDWLQKNDIPYDSLHFTGKKYQVRGDLLVDDLPSNLQQYLPYGKIVCYDQPWNKNYLYVPRARNMTELEQVIRDELK